MYDTMSWSLVLFHTLDVANFLITVSFHGIDFVWFGNLCLNEKLVHLGEGGSLWAHFLRKHNIGSQYFTLIEVKPNVCNVEPSMTFLGWMTQTQTNRTDRHTVVLRFFMGTPKT